MAFIDWLATVPWADIAVKVAIPVAAILIPTLIAIRLSKNERDAARSDNERERRLQAGAKVIVALAPLASMNVVTQSMQSHLWDLRAQIAVYRAWIPLDDISGDWLALRHREGMKLWHEAADQIDSAGGPNRLADHELVAILDVPHQWAATTTETFSGWLSGHLTTEVLKQDGARILQLFS